MFTKTVASQTGLAALLILGCLPGNAQTGAANSDQPYQQEETRQIVALVKDASDLIRTKGEAVFKDFAIAGSRWRQGDTYVFVLDAKGNMLVHPDPALEDHNLLELKDVHGKSIIRGLIAATAVPGKPEGWYHYQWAVPGGLLPRWKSTYVRLVTAPSGKSYIAGIGIYNDRMERAFVIDAVKNAAAQIEKDGRAAFPLFHDPAGRFIAKDAYIFVIDRNGVDLVNPGFPSLEGRNILDLKDTHGKQLIREMFQVAQSNGSGWVDYMWPKPGESVSTQKSAYVAKAKLGNQWVLVGCGVYLADAPKAAPAAAKMSASELMALVRDAAAVFAKDGDKAYPAFRKKGSKWFRDDTYFFVWNTGGTRVFHAADPSLEGQDAGRAKDVLGRPYGRMVLDISNNPAGEGWVHYMYPEPGDIFPAWKSVFAKRVTFPSGRQYIVGCGIYNMQMDRTFIEDVVDRASALVAANGKGAFAQLRDKTGPFVFMDTYVFVDTPDGIELVNPGQPSLEGTSLIDLKDVKGKAVARECIRAAMQDGSAWVDYYWYKPGHNEAARKETFVRRVQSGENIYIVGSGFYSANPPQPPGS